MLYHVSDTRDTFFRASFTGFQDGSCGASPAQEVELKNWLLKLELGEYCMQLVAEGYDSKKTIVQLDDIRFDEMATAVAMKLGHKARLRG